MIFDNLKNAHLYYGCHKGFEAAFDFIKKAISENLEPGDYEIDGRNVFASVQRYETRENSETFEGHLNYIDIQFIISGQEYMECASIDECEVISQYHEEYDYTHYVCNGLKRTVECQDNDFAVFFPHDIHKPGIKLDASSPVRKIVVKVHI